MEKPLFKHAGVYVTAILALGICVGGYYVTNQRQYQERVAYASEAGSQAKNEIQEFAQQTEELYQEDEPELLDEKASVSEVSSLQSEVNRIQVSAEDFQIEEDSMPEDLEEVATEKEDLSNRLTEANDKLHMQEQIDAFLMKRHLIGKNLQKMSSLKRVCSKKLSMRLAKILVSFQKINGWN
ncbi:hypothetical protein HRD57_10480 [Tetragenococcus halophilus]|nr:hypothetical protein [Tetragenococcus halophilus]